jgi:hypothetical protein
VFGISIWQILITVAIGLILWRGPTLLARLRDGLAGAVDSAARSGQGPGSSRSGTRRPTPETGGKQAIELQPCPRCGAYVDPREGCRCGEA